MSYDVEVHLVRDSGNGISVEGKVNGQPIAHTFPKKEGWFDESSNRADMFYDKLVSLYKKRYESLSASSAAEERKFEGNKYTVEDQGETRDARS